MSESDQQFLDALKDYAYGQLEPDWTREQVAEYVEGARSGFLELKADGLTPDQAFDEDLWYWDE